MPIQAEKLKERPYHADNNANRRPSDPQCHDGQRHLQHARIRYYPPVGEIDFSEFEGLVEEFVKQEEPQLKRQVCQGCHPAQQAFVVQSSAQAVVEECDEEHVGEDFEVAGDGYKKGVRGHTQVSKDYR